MGYFLYENIMNTSKYDAQKLNQSLVKLKDDIKLIAPTCSHYKNYPVLNSTHISSEEIAQVLYNIADCIENLLKNSNKLSSALHNMERIRLIKKNMDYLDRMSFHVIDDRGYLLAQKYIFFLDNFIPNMGDISKFMNGIVSRFMNPEDLAELDTLYQGSIQNNLQHSMSNYEKIKNTTEYLQDLTKSNCNSLLSTLENTKLNIDHESIASELHGKLNEEYYVPILSLLHQNTPDSASMKSMKDNLETLQNRLTSIQDIHQSNQGINNIISAHLGDINSYVDAAKKYIEQHDQSSENIHQVIRGPH